MQCRKFEGNLAEASAERSCGRGSGGAFLLFFFLLYMFLNLAEAAASAASMQFTALHVLCAHPFKIDPFQVFLLSRVGPVCSIE